VAQRVSVIIVTWNAGDVLGPCLDSVESQHLVGGFETIVVDNASTDSTQELLRRYDGRVQVITNPRNAGYAEANNQGADAASGRVLLFLNSDTELLETDVLERLASAVEEPGAGIVGPMLVNPDGTLQPSCASDPSVLRALLVGAGLHRLLPDAALARVAREHWSHSSSADVDWIMGAAIAIPAEVFRALEGFWGTTYAEEQDLAFRVRQMGLRVRFERSAVVRHIGNHSFGKRWTDEHRAGLVARAELVFLGTHYGRAGGAAIRAITAIAYMSRAAVLRLLRRRHRARVYAAMARAYAGTDTRRTTGARDRRA
jgi:N-acetylglucosaminyl-diphospho-decaprenol L-rhamnosyltransferase